MFAKDLWTKPLRTFGVLAGVVTILYACKQMSDQSVEDYKKVFTWPDSVAKNGYRYCTPSNYLSCSKNQWFGIVRDVNVDRADPVISKALNGLIDTACQHRSDPPLSHEMRIIKIRPNENLVLCRLRDPADIDRGKMLVNMERAGL